MCQYGRCDAAEQEVRSNAENQRWSGSRAPPLDILQYTLQNVICANHSRRNGAGLGGRLSGRSPGACRLAENRKQGNMARFGGSAARVSAC